MRHAKLASLVALTTLAVGCPDEDGGDTGAMTAPVSDSADDDGDDTETPGTTDNPTSSASASMTGDSMPTTDTPGTTTDMPETTTDDPTTAGGCTPDDECMTPADCPNPETDSCIGCLCVGEPPPTSSDYGSCDMCAAGEMPVQIMGLEGCFCSPGCNGAMSMCPEPNDGMAVAACVLGPPMGDPVQCALVCPVGMEGICPAGATCQDTGQMQMGVQIGLCTHPVP